MAWALRIIASTSGAAAAVGSGGSGKSGKSKIDDSAVLPDGTAVQGSKALTAYLMKNQQERFARGFSKHLLTYALGRSLEWTDQPLVDRLARDFQAGGYRMDKLIAEIVQSDAFTMK